MNTAPPPLESSKETLAVQLMNMHPLTVRVEPEVKTIAAPLAVEVIEVKLQKVNFEADDEGRLF